ncbi:hypothetical protein Q4F19_17165 [Sphingomonas sp. BIUV-7]|uniref:Late control gene D protein (GPD) n=1 Tax=Sphingomonas natans TaxID=3063330 RepID=A0ABT8YCS0_9SPHN|nr:hypothetical protein [Sphingomonas sp. BIUV-7]MDO6416119.1 hypothetical protein [Sphingomonas sp. BIUV-7]
MGFGAIITTGDGNRPLDAALAGCLTEVRVEQSLDDPAQFAIRFADDIEDGKLSRASDPRLKPETLMTIAVQVDQALVVLVRGPVTEHRSQMTVGGPGSWFEVHGLDRRDLLDRSCVQAAWTGRASDVARGILQANFDVANVEDTSRSYETNDTTLNQRSTDLSFLTQIARRNNLHFWISYVGEQSPLGGLQVTETANLASSPSRATGAVGAPLPLAPTTSLSLKVNVPPKDCPNVTAFQVSTDTARPSAYRTGAMQTAEVNPATTDVSDPQPPTGEQPKRLHDIGGIRRELCMAGAGDPVETQARGEAALTEAGFFVQATASTTKHMLGGILRPHDIVSAIGVGPALGPAAFRVKQVTHVINAAEHFMDLALESNGLGG